MRKTFLFIIIILLITTANAQTGKYSTFYDQRATLFEELPVSSKDIIFLGNSIRMAANGRNS